MNTSSNEDPYDMFGSDNDDDNDDETIIDPNKIPTIVKNRAESTIQSLAQTLKDNANQRNSEKIQKQQQSNQELIGDQQQQQQQQQDDVEITKYTSNDTTTSFIAISSPWENMTNDGNTSVIQQSYQPLYVGPLTIIQSSEYGGNRALVATQLLQPGTLVLVEETIFTWSIDTTTTDTNTTTSNIDYLNPTILQRLIQQQQQQQQQESKFEYNSTNTIANSISNNTETNNNNTTTSKTTDNNTANNTNDTINVLHCIEFLHPTKIIVDQYLMVNDDNSDDSDCDVIARIQNPTTVTLSDDDEIQIIQMILSLQEQQKQLQLQQQQQQQQQQSLLPSDTKKTKTSIDNNNIQQQEVLVDTNTNDWNIDNLYEIIQYVRQNNIYNSNGTIYTILDFYRTIVAIRYNGLQSGIYLYSALINHNDTPNCVKFLPNNKSLSTSTTSCSKNINNVSYSEILTTRHVQVGEVLTISYIPTIISYVSRQQYLWKQHKFDISQSIQEQEQQQLSSTSSSSSSALYKMELIKGQFPIALSSSSSQQRTNDNDVRVGVAKNDDNPITSIIIDDLICIVKNIEKSITDLSDLYNDAYDAVQIILKQEQLQQQQKSQSLTMTKKNNTSSTGSNVKVSTSIDYSIFDHCAALEQSIYELYNESKIQLQNNIHILLIPCLLLHLDVCYLLLQYTLLEKSIRYKIYIRMIYTSQKLIALQCLYYGNNNHYNLARTYLDLANAIDSLLTNSNQSLLSIGGRKIINNSIITTSSTTNNDNAANVSSMEDDMFVTNDEYDWPTSISAWSSFEYKARVEYNRIKALYPHDVEQYIQQII